MAGKERKSQSVSRRDFLKLAPLGAGIFLGKRIDPILDYEVEGPNVEYGEKLSEILDNFTTLKFDEEGYLTTPQKLEQGEWDRLMLIPTRYNQEHHNNSNKVESVKLFVVHFDGAFRNYRGQPRTAQNTLNGVNGNYASVHWCVDEYKLAVSGEESDGFGVLQTHIPSDERTRPYEGAHVLIGINLKTGEPDITRLTTLERFRRLGINSKIEDLEERRTRDYDRYSVGAEQVGRNFSRSFPENFPPASQFGNFLALTIAVMNEYGLSPWDVVGHHEIQEKDDPGDEFMATLRFSLAVAYIAGVSDVSFFHSNSPSEYLTKLGQYYRERMGEERFTRWDEYLEFSFFLRNYLRKLSSGCRDR